MSAKTLLLLGGSRQQVVAIETAKACGYRTVLCDYLPDNPGQFSADVFYQVSTIDRKAVLDVARQENVDGVIAYSSDPASPTAAYVAETLGLPTNPLAAVETMSEKHLFRAHLTKSGLPCPKAYGFTINVSAADNSASNLSSVMESVANAVKDFNLPLVVKPTDSSGSKGVTVIDSLAEIRNAIVYANGFSRNKTLICEEYIAQTFPHVIGGDIFVVDGKVVFWGLMSCLRDEGSALVPVGKKTPSGLFEDQLDRVKDVLQRLVSSLGVQFGELNVEVIIGKDGVPYVLELGSRAGGNMIPVQLSDASGVDLVRANVMCAIGEDPGDISWDGKVTDGSAYATYVLHSLKDGVFEGVEYSPEILGHVYREVIYINQGDKVERFDGANKAIGIIFLKFESESQMNEMLGAVSGHVKVCVR